MPPLSFLAASSPFFSIPSLLASTREVDLSATQGQAESEAQTGRDPPRQQVSSTGPDVTPPPLIGDGLDRDQAPAPPAEPFSPLSFPKHPIS